MENAAEQYAFYVHGAKVAEKDRERLEGENADLTKKNADMQSSLEKATAALMDVQKELKATKAEFDGYEAKESAKVEALKEKTMKLVAAQREHEVALVKRGEEIDDRELNCKKTELVTRVAVAESAKEKADLQSVKHGLDDRTQALIAAENDLASRESDIVQRAQANSREAEVLRSKAKEMESARTAVVNDLNSVNQKLGELATREALISDGVKRIAAKEEALKPVVDLSTEFKHFAVQYAGDSEKVKAWLEAHCV